MKKRRRKAPHFQSPIHYLVKAGMSRKQGLHVLKHGLGLDKAKIEGSVTSIDTRLPEATVSRAYAEGLKDALQMVL